MTGGLLIPRLALKSLRSRWLTALLTVLAIGFSVMLFLGVEKVRDSARSSFTNTISGTDLIIGSRAGSIQLLLYSVFRIGNATANITWESYEDIKSRPEVAWTIPFSLGDSHRGYRVLGTNADYFEHYRYRRKQALTFAQGQRFEDLFDAVLGADVASELNYKLGDRIVVSHGLGSVGFSDHADKPFRVAGILNKTGTPLDRTVHVSLEAIEAIHLDWQNGAPIPGRSISAEQVRRMNLSPRAITSALVGVKSKLQTFRLQRFINTYKEEALSAILPGVALQELWQLVATAETALRAVSSMVVITALLGMITMILTTLNERRREMAILRSVGAGPRTVFGLLVAEASLLTFFAICLGTALVYGALILIRSYVDTRFGLFMELDWPTAYEWATLGFIWLGGTIAGILPALRAYSLSVADGMMVKN